MAKRTFQTLYLKEFDIQTYKEGQQLVAGHRTGSKPKTGSRSREVAQSLSDVNAPLLSPSLSPSSSLNADLDPSLPFRWF